LVLDKTTLFSVIMSDAINLGLVKMAEAYPGLTCERLAWVSDWYIRDENYSKGLANVINFHTKVLFSAYWGDGKTSSSDGQRLKAAGPHSFNQEINAKYGNDRGVTFYTHISDQYAPFHTKVINATITDATHILDGLLYVERTLFTLNWLQSPILRPKATNELNKGELKNCLSRAVSFHRLGEVRDRSFEDQSLPASGLNLTIMAIVL
jgi:TnpA family transposase